MTDEEINGVLKLLDFILAEEGPSSKDWHETHMSVSDARAAASAIRQLMMERDEAREVMLCALKCTPSVVVPSDGGPRIVYDCGDPWELLRAFLAKHPPTPS
jgi:hypothetical protein